ncbi:hypothetical protein [uncultured Erythrobacter sp.]|uniref:hypothetical protein n=1 Tax=uncultured Erythrobacter sp. TaxID=263913 RepID=UPI002630F94E|nr:hypothetical protein [uncultured Erythrobacter sp.]
MNGYWGAIGLVVLGVVGVMASSGPSAVYKSEGEYVAQCTTGISNAVPRSEAIAGCKCVYRNALPVVEARGDSEMTDKEADLYYDKCLAPVVARMEAEAAWNAEASDASSSTDGGWGGDAGGSSDWNY